MSIFTRIKDAIFGHDTKAATPAPSPAAAKPASSGIPASPADANWQQTSTSAPANVDVEQVLTALAAKNPQKLNWRTSIVDLLKLLDIDSSFAARNELATELACPPELMSDSAKMNTWLHKTVLARIAANGGNVPRELLD